MKTSKILNESELTVYLNELNSPRLCWLDDDDFHDRIVEMLQEISLLTGAEVYESDWKNEMLIKTIENLFRFNSEIMNLTVNEIRNAFYLNHNGTFGKVYTMYGKPISADYVGNVISEYREYKLRPLEKQWAIDRLLNPPPPKPVPVYTVEDYKAFIQTDYENWKAGNQEYIFLVFEKYLVMRRLGIIIYPNLESWAAWKKRALAKREYNLINQIPINKAEKQTKKKKLELYKAIRETNIIPPEENKSVIHMLRKLVYFRYFELLKEAGVVNIFAEISNSIYENGKIQFVKIKK